MSSTSPHTTVKTKFGGKDKLAAQLSSSMDVPEGQSREDFQKRLKGLANAKLLKLKRVEDAFKDRFGGKTESAVAAIIAKRALKGKDADAFKAHAQSLSRAQLLDLAGPAVVAKAAPKAKKA